MLMEICWAKFKIDNQFRIWHKFVNWNKKKRQRIIKPLCWWVFFQQEWLRGYHLLNTRCRKLDCKFGKINVIVSEPWGSILLHEGLQKNSSQWNKWWLLQLFKQSGFLKFRLIRNYIKTDRICTYKAMLFIIFCISEEIFFATWSFGRSEVFWFPFHSLIWAWEILDSVVREPEVVQVTS